MGTTLISFLFRYIQSKLYLLYNIYGFTYTASWDIGYVWGNITKILKGGEAGIYRTSRLGVLTLKGITELDIA